MKMSFEMASAESRKAEAWRLVAERSKGPPLDIRSFKKAEIANNYIHIDPTNHCRTISPVQPSDESSYESSPVVSPWVEPTVPRDENQVVCEGKLPFKKRRKLGNTVSSHDSRTPSPHILAQEQYLVAQVTSPAVQHDTNHTQSHYYYHLQEKMQDSAASVSYTAEDEAAAAEALVSVVQSALVEAQENSPASTTQSVHTSSILASMQMDSQIAKNSEDKNVASPLCPFHNKRNRSLSEPFFATKTISRQLEEVDGKVMSEHYNHPHENPDVLSSKFPHLLPLYLSTYNRNNHVGIYTPSQRQTLLQKFRHKRQTRKWNKKVIRYNCRKDLADRRLRIKGRFVKRDENGGHLLPTAFRTSTPTSCGSDLKGDDDDDDPNIDEGEEYHSSTPESSPYRRTRRVTVA